MFRCRRSVSAAASFLQQLTVTGCPQVHGTRHYHELCRCLVQQRLTAGRAAAFTSVPFGSSLVPRARMAAFAVNAHWRQNNARKNKLTELQSLLTVRPARDMQTRPSSSSSSSAPEKHDLPPASGAEGQGSDRKPSKAQQLRKVFKEYGAVGVSFHIGISLLSLGMFYLAVSSGLDMTSLLCKLGFSEAVVQSKMAAGTSTFVLAYAVHKLFAPVRISITLVCVPLIVRHLRKTGLFKARTSGP